MENTFVIPPRSAFVHCSDPVVRITLFDGRESDQKVPCCHDLARVSLDSVPDGLEVVELRIGGYVVHDVPAELVSPGADIFQDLNGGAGLPLSKARYMVAELAFRFSREHVERGAWESEDETREEVSESEDETDFVDSATGELRSGRRLHRRMVSTGGRVRRPVGVEVRVPSTCVTTRAAPPRSVAALQCNVRVMRTMTFGGDEGAVEAVRRCGRSVEPLGGRSVADLARVGNELRFSEGMAGLVWAL